MKKRLWPLPLREVRPYWYPLVSLYRERPRHALRPKSNYGYVQCTSFVGISSSCDSWAEQDIDDVESKSSKKTRKRRGSKQSKTKGKEQNFVKRNIEVEFIPLCHFRNAFCINSLGERCLVSHLLPWQQLSFFVCFSWLLMQGMWFLWQKRRKND